MATEKLPQNVLIQKGKLAHLGRAGGYFYSESCGIMKKHKNLYLIEPLKLQTAQKRMTDTIASQLKQT